jgi:hypothetical protein
VLCCKLSKYFLEHKKVIQILLIFFLNEKKIKSCKSLSGIIRLTLRVKKQHIQPVEQYLTKQIFKMISFFNIKITTYWIDLSYMS